MVAKGDIFHNPATSIPKSDPKLIRIDFDVEETGARKSHTKGLHKRNGLVINHVGGKGA